MAYAPSVELRGVAARDLTATEWLALTAAGSTTGSALAHPFGFEDWGTAPERCGDAHAWLFDPYDPVSGDPTPSTWAQRAARAVVGHADEVELHVRPVVDLVST